MVGFDGVRRRSFPVVTLSCDQRQEFIRQHTVIASPSVVPEIRLHLATEITPLWQANESLLQVKNIDPPYWAFAWPGGQALARYLLDHPETVRGKSVFDFGSGSGLVAIAAAKAGALISIGNDRDLFAGTAMTLNGTLNNATITVDTANHLDQSLTAEIIVAGDMCYEREPSRKILAWLRRLATDRPVFLADPGRYYAPKDGLNEVARYDIPTSLDIEEQAMRTTTVWRLLP